MQIGGQNSCKERGLAIIGRGNQIKHIGVNPHTTNLQSDVGRVRKAIAKFEYEGINIEVYDRTHLNTIFQKIMKESRTRQRIINNHDIGEETDTLPTIAHIVQVIQQLPDNMTHSYSDLMMKLMSKRIPSTGSKKDFYRIFVRRACSARKLIEKAQSGRFVSETRIVRENGYTTRIRVFRFAKRQATAKDHGNHQ